MSAAANHAAPDPDPGPDLGIEFRLPADAYWHLIHTLRLALPPPPGDRPEDLLRRDHAAVARIAALAPGNAVEADLAAQFVAASEQWKDCLRLAQDPDMAPKWAAKCRAQALAMMRQANAALRLLLRLQTRRGKLEADNAACDRATWTEHCATAMMVEALAAAPHPGPLPEGEGAEKPAPSGRGAEQPSPSGRGLGEGEPPDLAAAARIRRAGQPADARTPASAALDAIPIAEPRCAPDRTPQPRAA